MNRRRIACVVSLGLVVGLALAWSAISLAGTGYRMYVASWHRPPSGSSYSVTVHGRSPQKVLVYVYLDSKRCRSTWASEANRLTRFKAGQSYFRHTGRGSKQEAFTTLWVSGHFNKSFTAHAGTTARREYACAYLTTPNSRGLYQVTAAHTSSAYTVTN